MGRAMNFDRGNRPRNVPRDKRQQTGMVPLPPMPEDPTKTCRWCLGRMVTLSIGRHICSHGCADQDKAPYIGLCDECGRGYESGKPHTPDLCWECERRIYRRTVKEFEHTPRSVGYDADMRAKGASRHAMQIKERGNEP